jgi:hypothetical protein
MPKDVEESDDPMSPPPIIRVVDPKGRVSITSTGDAVEQFATFPGLLSSSEDAAVDDLLHKPFEQALEENLELRKHIDEHEEPEEPGAFREHFRQHWGPEAPDELREILKDVMILQRSPALPAVESTQTAEGKQVVTVSSLLGKPFDQALQEFPPLQRYLEENETEDDPGACENEFRGHWGLEAPTDLRELLDDLLNNPTRVKVNLLFSKPFDEALKEFPELREYIKENDPEDDPGACEQEFRLHWGMEEAPADLHMLLENLLNPEPEKAKDPEVASLLAKPFDQALKECPQLRTYIDESKKQDDSGQEEKELRAHWGPEAPAAMHEFLRDLLHPEEDAAEATVAE